MKKFTTIAMSILCGLSAVYAQETTVYLLGEFNEFGNGDLTGWEFTVDDQSSEFEANGTFNIPAGEFSVSFMIDGQYYVTQRRSGNESFSFYDGEYFVGLKTSEDPESQLLICEEWEGGDVEIYMEIINNTYMVTFIDPSYVPSDEPNIAYVIGAFNEYSEDDDDYVLMEEEEYIYSGYIDIPEGEFSFNIYVPSQDTLYVPVENETIEITFVNDIFSGDVDNYSTSWKEMYWEYTPWEGGTVKITLDTDGGIIEIEADLETSVKAINLENSNKQIYNIQGMKVDREKLTPGLYIVNGKKVMFSK